LVWRGAIDGAVGDIGDLDRQIEKGVHAILKKYPVEQDSDDDKEKVKRQDDLNM
jgi:hypothetical protein